MIKGLIAKFFFKVISSSQYASYVQHDIQKSSGDLLCKFKSMGESSRIPSVAIIKNPKYISIGDNFVALQNLRLEAWDEYAGEKFSPDIRIGNNVIFNTDVHIGCINKVWIGDNVMLASRIYISDHSHGEINAQAFNVVPRLRPLISRGPVIIEDNVWIGEGACLLPGVSIGKNSIVGANAVVTKNIPPNSIAVGVPARVLRSF